MVNNFIDIEHQNKSLNPCNLMLETISNVPIGTGFLAFRDLGKILSEYIAGTNALDFGCGAGRSSRILQQHGLTVVGADISKEMIDKAINMSKDITYFLIEKNDFKELGTHFDLIFVSFVLMELPNKLEIITLLSKLKNLLAENGKIILIVASDDFYNSNWLSIDTKSFKNSTKQSGEVVSVYLKDYKITINDYLWTENDYEQCFKQSNMVLLQKLKPVGTFSDEKKWIDEYTKAPFVIYVLSK